MKTPHKHAELIKENIGRFIYLASGDLIWAENYGPRARKGALVGCKDTHGYLQVKLSGKFVFVHRIIWYMHKFSLPEQIDHINRDRGDNRIENLRESCNLQNTQNAGLRKDNKHGCAGVGERHGKWFARIGCNGNRIHLGTFLTLEDAKNAYIAAKLKHHSHADAAVKRYIQDTENK